MDSGFDGDLLVKNSPEKVTISDRELNLFGVRRAFAAPPTTEGTQIVYDQKSDKNKIDFYEKEATKELYVKKEREDVSETTGKFVNLMLSDFHHSKSKAKYMKVVKG